MKTKYNIAFNGSGGSTKGIGIYHAFKTLMLDYNVKPNIYSGISISALIGVPLMMKKFKELDYLFENFNLSFIFNKPPVNNNGNLTCNAKFRAITGKNSLGEMYPIMEVLSDIVKPSDFVLYHSNNELPPVITMSVDYKSGKRIFVNHKELKYDEWLLHCLASASIPVFTPPIPINDYLLYDGGVREHCIGHYIKETFNVKESYSIYSRPKDKNITNNNWDGNNILDVLSRTTEIQQLEISKNDEEKEYTLFKNKNNLKQIFLPNILNSLYDTDRNRLNQLKIESIKEVKKTLNYEP